jgi:ribonuclease HI
VEGNGVVFNGPSVNIRLNISLGEHATVIQAEVYAVLACLHETETQARTENYVSVCSDSQAALKALQAAKTSHFVRQCQQALNGVSTRHALGLYWVSGHAGLIGNEIAGRLASSSCIQQFVGLEPFLGVSRQYIRRNMEQHMSVWRGPCSTQRQALELISDPDLAKRDRLLSCNWTCSIIVVGLFTRH